MSETQSAQPMVDRGRPVAGLRVLPAASLHMFDEVFARADSVRIGRTRQCEIRIRDETVARQHCTLERSIGRGYLLHVLPGKVMYVTVPARYGPPCKLPWVELAIGMHVQLGDSILVPVDARGQAPVTVWRHSEFIRCMLEQHGSVSAACEHAGIPRRLAARFLADGRADPQADTQEGNTP